MRRSAKMQPKLVSTSHIPGSRSGRYRTEASRQQPVIARIERIAGSVTEGIVAMAPLFWLALFFAFAVASLG
jgi:hypothetical protein